MTSKNQRYEHFRQDMADILAKRAEFPGALVTVIDAHISDDQKFATVFLSVLPTTAEETVLESLKTFRHDIIKEMAKTLKLRKLPIINWRFDYTEAQAQDIEKYMNELKEKGEL
jgi:ribosome-binding factor A